MLFYGIFKILVKGSLRFNLHDGNASIYLVMTILLLLSKPFLIRTNEIPCYPDYRAVIGL